ncbi:MULTISPECIES: 16S rRNA (uracil(1498)-N(3))-methyltransferase [Bacteria]|uniref:16S rRNA (uracil(1498)-N(3))-methyltransferase n=1 Tax=Bacteria TaxID=2 RepID=UPI003C7D952F
MALHFLTADAAGAEPGDVVTLGGAEARHAAVVRRVRAGERVTLGDGGGVWLGGVVETTGPGSVAVRVETRELRPAPTSRVILVQALAKGDRDERAVQAACELGVDEIVPWQAARSVSRWDGTKAAKGRERWATIVREAAKQAHRAWVPEVSAVETTADIASRAASQRVLVLDPAATTRVSTLQDDGRDVVLVVGPEGGIATEELERLSAAGAERMLLGETVLRTSTAGPAALAALNVLRGRW